MNKDYIFSRKINANRQNQNAQVIITSGMEKRITLFSRFYFLLRRRATFSYGCK